MSVAVVMESEQTHAEGPCCVCELGADGPCPACNGRGVVVYVVARRGEPGAPA